MADVSLSSAEISDIAQVYMSNTIRLTRLNNHIFDVRVYALISVDSPHPLNLETCTEAASQKSGCTKWILKSIQ